VPKFDSWRFESLLAISVKNAKLVNYEKFRRMFRDKAGNFQDESGTYINMDGSDSV
jgi:hypothetical protein